MSRGSLSNEVSVRETPLYGKERAVHILLECFLVLLVSAGEFVEFIGFSERSK